MAMLPHAFFDWWFAPWTYAELPHALPLASDRLGLRDGYRLWCRQAEVAADLPERFDAGWHVAAGSHGGELFAAACLYSGLIAARAHDGALLAELAFEDRKWCVSVAATQPLRGYGDGVVTATDPIAVRGLFELALRLQHDFPGMWSRLRLGLPAEIAERIEVLLDAARALNRHPEGTALRAQRCWMLCRQRAASRGTSDVLRMQAADGAAMAN